MIRGSVPERHSDRHSQHSHRDTFVIMTCQRLLYSLLLLIVPLQSLAQSEPNQQASAASEAEPASLSLFVFAETQPQAGVEVTLNGNSIGRTQESGRITASIEPGSYELQVSLPGQAPWRREFQFTAAELVQILVNFFADESTPFVDIETSNQNKLALSDAQQVDVDAEPGTLSGRITSSEDGRGIAGVRVFVSGVADEQVTAEDGSYSFELPPGEYSLSVLAARFNTRTLENIPISSEQTTRQDLKLTPAGSELPVYVVVEPFVEGSLASVLDERRQSSSVSDILSAEQFAKTGDSNAASALKRVPGLSLVGGKFVFVRGLGERYSSTLINGMPVPSPDPTRKVIPLDIFPTSVIKSISVQKTLSANMPGEFGGGTVNLRTNGIPDEGFFNIGFAATYDTRTTFKDALTSQGSPTDVIGFDNGSRNLPDSFDVIADERLSRSSPFNPDGLSPQEIESLTEDLGRDWELDTFTAPPSFDFNIALGDRYDINSDWQWGFTGALDYGIDWDSQEEIRRQFTVSQGDELQALFDNVLNVTEEVVETSTFLSSEIGRIDGSHSINYTVLLVRQSLFDNRISEGFSARDGINLRRGRIRYNENEAFINQLIGHHEIGLLQGLNFDWGLSHNSSAFEEPNRRAFRFDEIEPGQFFFSRFADSNLIRFTDLDEKAKSAQANLRLDMELASWLDLGFYAGTSFLDRNRESNLRRFQIAPRGPDSRDPEVLALPLNQIFSPEFIGNNGFLLREGTLSTDFYVADQELFTYHFGTDWNIADVVRLDTGLRVEDNTQIVRTFEPFVANPSETIASIAQTDYLPALSATWFVSEQHQLKLAYSESVNRPQFREFAEAPFNDVTIDADVIGNPDLVQAELENFDLRWDWFFSDAEFISLSGFYKTIENPIELVRIPTDSSNLASLLNALDGELLGAELEYRVNLERLWQPLSNFYLTGNFSLIDSEVTLDPDSASSAQTDQTRNLQGQSDSIINVTLGYEDLDSGLDATLSFNQEGNRITAAGILGIPNTIETPPALLDFVIRKQWDHLRLTLDASNLLDQATTFFAADRIERQFKAGREIKLGVDYAF